MAITGLQKPMRCWGSCRTKRWPAACAAQSRRSPGGANGWRYRLPDKIPKSGKLPPPPRLSSCRAASSFRESPIGPRGIIRFFAPGRGANLRARRHKDGPIWASHTMPSAYPWSKSRHCFLIPTTCDSHLASLMQLCSSCSARIFWLRLPRRLAMSSAQFNAHLRYISSPHINPVNDYAQTN